MVAKGAPTAIEILLLISNTVHHGLVNAPKDWQYSSFHRYIVME
ncbi:hypothetical protein [Microcystis aeruginosa]|nr:hypothetical protein [Microcystis aeruginosa]